MALVFAMACGDEALDPGTPAGSLPVMVSDAAVLVGAPGETVTWVALPPGTIADGVEATVTTRLGQGRVTVPLVDGGFDPVPLPAVAGDTVEITIRDADDAVVTVTTLVPVRAVPIVVRTDPPKKKKDVPLNLRALVVFSEPMNPATVTPATVRLLRNGQPVPATVSLNAAWWRAEVVPDEFLAGATDYVLEVTTGVRDAAGEPLAQALRIEFTTATASTAPVERIEVIPDSLNALIGQYRQLGVRVLDAGGEELFRKPRWSVADPTVARIDDHGIVQALRPGTVTVTASIDTIEGTARLLAVPAVALGVAEFHVCVVGGDGRTYCWGNDYLGHLGTPPDSRDCRFLHNSDNSCLTVPSPVPGAPTFSSLAGGEFFTCGLTGSGAAYCWGRLWDDLVHGPTLVPGGHAFVTLTAGALHACGLTAGGAAYCWGANGHGQLGDSSVSADARAVPVLVAGGHTFSAISAFWRQSCAVDAEGRGWCWGANPNGELGIGRASEYEWVPTAVAGDARFVRIEPGYEHTCGLADDGTAYCWGASTYGEVGNTSSSTPLPVRTSLRFTALDTGQWYSCGLSQSDATVWCWGAQYDDLWFSGQSYSDTAAAPALVRGIPFVTLGLGRMSACGITASGGTRCWGDDLAGQIGPFRR